MSEEWPTDRDRPSTKEALQSLTEKDWELIGLRATVAQQAQMIEYLRGGAPNDPRVVSYAEDMSTCTLTNGDGIGYCYDRVDPDQPAGYTAVDMATAAADGFRDGAAEAKAAVLTLQGQGYTYHGAQLWKPPVGQKPRFDELDRLRAENERLRNESADALAVNRTIRQQLDCYVKDAERYRWIRSPAAWNGSELVASAGGTLLDEAIDKAMSKEG